MSAELKDGYNLNLGPVYAPGQRPVKTGNWRVFRPEIDVKKCNLCLLCWIFCPDGAIKRREDRLEIDYDYCKGCGICSVECSVQAVKMVRE